MNLSLSFIRSFFLFIATLFAFGFFAATSESITFKTLLFSLLTGAAISTLLLALERAFRKFHLRAFNITLLGLFFGFLMSQVLIVLFNGVVQLTTLKLRPEILEGIRIFLLLSGSYLGVILTLRSSNELSISIPFMRFSPTQQKTKEVIADLSSLFDGRILDIATTGLLDGRLIIPRFLLKDLYAQAESLDEVTHTKANLALEIVKKLECLSSLNLKFHDTDFPEIKDSTAKVLRMARLLDADVFSADINRVEMSTIEGVKIVNIHALSSALKPLMQRGEFLTIKVQRPGKEERQGVGYLEDGTMVVVNGGGDFLGMAIKAYVLSVKHTTSGRMIFCNVAEEPEMVSA